MTLTSEEAAIVGYRDAHRYRLRINHSRLQVNEPQGVAARRGVMAGAAK